VDIKVSSRLLCVILTLFLVFFVIIWEEVGSTPWCFDLVRQSYSLHFFSSVRFCGFLKTKEISSYPGMRVFP